MWKGESGNEFSAVLFSFYLEIVRAAAAHTCPMTLECIACVIPDTHTRSFGPRAMREIGVAT